jgi:hypothetical protein
MRAADLRTVAGAKFTTFKAAFRSREGFKYFIETGPTALDRHGNPSEGQTWSNEDLDPTPPEKVPSKPFLRKPLVANCPGRGHGDGGTMSPSTWACPLETGRWEVPWWELD